MHKYRLEIALVGSVAVLALQLCLPPLMAWLDEPYAGSLGVIRLKDIEGLNCLSNECLVYLPPTYDYSASFPLLLYLHGAGDRGSDLMSVREHGLPGYLSDGGKYPTIVAVPQCRKNCYWQPDELSRLLDFLEGQFAVDLERIYILGESMGGSGAWSLAHHSPQRFAAVVPLCGGGDPQAGESLKNVPIWAFHGEQDNIVPLAESESMVNAVAKVGGNARLTVLEGRGHDLRDLAWKHEALVEWMLNQRREVRSNP